MSSCWNRILLIITSLTILSSCKAATVEVDSKAVIIDGQRKLIISGAIHYPRSAPDMWPDLIQKAKDGGLDAIETYIFWNAHEPRRGEYDFSGNLDFIKFFQIVQEAGLYGILRIGPYVCAQWNYGGFPVWLHNIEGIKLRTDNEIYKNEVQNFTTKIVDMAKQAKLFAPDGGPIILAQIENEYGNVMGAYGDAGKSYLQWCADMAVSQNIGVPWVMSQQADAPPSVINTCNGFYCDQFQPNNPQSPKIWTENWTGWFKTWGQRDPKRMPQDLAFAVARFFQKGGILQNYYMYHGGTNFGRTSGGPLITTSYDYDAPLDEYGYLNMPKWGHLKDLHAAIKSGEKIMTSNNSKIETETFSDGWVERTTYTDNDTGEKFCFLSNDNGNSEMEGQDYLLPPWSVSIRDIGCNVEIFNTAKVHGQTSVRKVNNDDRNLKVSWMWAPENLEDTLGGKGEFVENKLREQKATTSDVSDYLWYMISVTAKSRRKMTLHVNFYGQVLYAFVNGQLIGSQTGETFTFEKPVTFNPGPNIITLLSVTVGLQNYGEFFDEVPDGIAGGPVQLIDESTTFDLSSKPWAYKVGLDGEGKELYNPNSQYRDIFNTSDLPVGRGMTWYKTTLDTPFGDDPVVLDLQGMGKGQAWINGYSLGRYWSSQIADPNGCTHCSYQGEYYPDRCHTNCGNPTQTLYHVPRSFLREEEENTLVLFEEVGGNPYQVSLKTITSELEWGHYSQVSSTEFIWGNAYQGSTLQLSCPRGRIISDIQFANPQGNRGSFQKGDGEASPRVLAMEKACVGKESCSIRVSESTLQVKNLGNHTGRLAVQARCV